VTDILCLYKRAAGETTRHADPAWLDTAPLTIEGVDVPINRYFLQHPEMVLGTWTCQDRLYGSETGYSLLANGDLAAQLQEAIGRLPKGIFTGTTSSDFSTAAEKLETSRIVPPPEQHLTEGSFFIHDNLTIMQVQDGLAVPVKHGDTLIKADGTMMGQRLRGLITLRNYARRVLQSQNEGWSEALRHQARVALNRVYDSFVEKYGPINKTTITMAEDGTVTRRMPNLVKFRDNPDAMLVMSLEQYDEATGGAEKAAIMYQDVVGRSPPITSVNSAEEGLLVSLDQKGTVDLPYIAPSIPKMSGRSSPSWATCCIKTPTPRHGRRPMPTSPAMCGPNSPRPSVPATPMPATPRRCAAYRPRMCRPATSTPISAHHGYRSVTSSILPHRCSACRAPTYMSDTSRKTRSGRSKRRSPPCGPLPPPRITARSAPTASGCWSKPSICAAQPYYDTIVTDGKEERVLNQEATLAAREKQKRIQEQFRAWISSDPDRTERLVRLYNDTYNTIRLRSFDGSHLDFPGMSQAITLRPHQKDAVWRVMSSGNTLLAHAVGAGKTYTMAAAGMKMKQAGLLTKPLYVVPNHMLEQFGREFMQLYPNARLLIAGKEDFTRERRKLLTAKMASGAWDGIITTQSSFERIGMSRDYQERFLREQIAEYDQLLCDSAAADTSRAHRNILKTIEKAKAKREDRLKELLAQEKKDDGLVFDELGVDHIFIDESHVFKNLETPTKMERVAGIQTTGSERAFDLYMKTGYLHLQHPGHGVTFATGTPISNTMVEMYTIQRYLDPDGLYERGIDHFDAWAASFGEVVETMEISPDGRSLRPAAASPSS
jgi:N12 class adenine-specific DNA methylase